MNQMHSPLVGSDHAQLDSSCTVTQSCCLLIPPLNRRDGLSSFSQVHIAVDPDGGGQSLVVVAEAAAPKPGGRPGSPASDAVCLGFVASCQHHPQVSVPASR